MSSPNARVRSVLESLVHDGGESGLQVAAYLEGKPVIDVWADMADDVTRRRVDADTLFTAFSISKGITATCVHILADRGLIDYDAPIASYWPEFGVKGKDKATVRHALTHRVGIPQDPPDFDIGMAHDWDAVCRLVAQMEPAWEPGTRTGYHPLTYGWMLGEIVRRVDGRPIARFLQEEVCRPLGINDMYFGVPPDAENRVATLRNAPVTAQPDVVSLAPSLVDTAGVFNRSEIRRASIPGAGAIVNARSVARHYAMLAEGGELDGVRLLSRERIATATSPQPEDADTAGIRWWTRHGLGYTLGGGTGPMAGRPDAFGYEGVGTVGFADPSRRFACAFLKNVLDMSAHEMDSATVVVLAVEDALGIA